MPFDLCHRLHIDRESLRIHMLYNKQYQRVLPLEELMDLDCKLMSVGLCRFGKELPATKASANCILQSTIR